jgi:hypothetical protein
MALKRSEVSAVEVWSRRVTPVKERTAAVSRAGRSTERTKPDAASCSCFKTFSCEAEVSTRRTSESGASVSRSKEETRCSTPSSSTRTSSARSVLTKRRFLSSADRSTLVRSVSMRSTASASSGVGEEVGVGEGVGEGVGVGVSVGEGEGVGV